MKAKRYMKPPSCRKPATVIVPYAGQALDGQRPTRTISEPRILSVNPGRKSWEGTKGTTSPCPSRVKSCPLANDRFWRIVLKKSFWGDDQNFSGLPMRFARGDMRDHIVSHKNDHGASYERYGVLQWWSRLKISFCEIFGVVQFSTFATLSPRKQTSSA